MKYIILLIGSGGREHAIAKALFRTKDNEDKIDLYCFASHNNPQLRRLSQQMIIGKSIDDLEVFIDIIGSIYDSKFINYGWKKNSGYGTKQHINAIYENGITVHHRKTFEPIKTLSKQF